MSERQKFFVLLVLLGLSLYLAWHVSAGYTHEAGHLLLP